MLFSDDRILNAIDSQTEQTVDRQCWQVIQYEQYDPDTINADSIMSYTAAMDALLLLGHGCGILYLLNVILSNNSNDI